MVALGGDERFPPSHGSFGSGIELAQRDVEQADMADLSLGAAVADDEAFDLVAGDGELDLVLAGIGPVTVAEESGAIFGEDAEVDFAGDDLDVHGEQGALELDDAFGSKRNPRLEGPGLVVGVDETVSVDVGAPNGFERTEAAGDVAKHGAVALGGGFEIGGKRELRDGVTGATLTEGETSAGRRGSVQQIVQQGSKVQLGRGGRHGF